MGNGCGKFAFRHTLIRYNRHDYSNTYKKICGSCGADKFSNSQILDLRDLKIVIVNVSVEIRSARSLAVRHRSSDKSTISAVFA